MAYQADHRLDVFLAGICFRNARTHRLLGTVGLESDAMAI